MSISQHFSKIISLIKHCFIRIDKKYDNILEPKTVRLPFTVQKISSGIIGLDRLIDYLYLEIMLYGKLMQEPLMRFL